MTRLGLIFGAALSLYAAHGGAQTMDHQEITIRQGTVGNVGGERVGVRWVWEDDYVGAGGKTEHGMAAGITFATNERKQTVGKGSVVEVKGQHWTVTGVVEKPGSITLRRDAP